MRPVPTDDHAADHLTGVEVPALVLESSQGAVDLRELCASFAVVYVYPPTATQGVPQPEGWATIPGAVGCTAESRAFHDRSLQFSKLGTRVAGRSAQSLAEASHVGGRSRADLQGLLSRLLARHHADEVLNCVRAMNRPGLAGRLST